MKNIRVIFFLAGFLTVPAASQTITSPFMSLPVPQVGLDSGPDFANNINSSLFILDAHNHTPGYGVPVPASGLLINADLPFAGNNATLLRSTRFQSQSAVLSGGSDLSCAYVKGGDLYFNDGSGNQIRLTQSGGIAGTPGSISNLTAPASAAYVAGSSTFIWQSATSTPAKMDFGPILLRKLSASSAAITIAPSNSLSSNYSLTLPATLPGSTLPLTVSNTGQVTANAAPAVTSIQLGGSLATLTSTNTKTVGISDGSVTRTIVTSPAPATNALMMVRGRVDSSGSILSGEGFTVSAAAGQATITFSTAFTDTPSVTALEEVNAATNSSYMWIKSVSSSSVVLITGNGSGSSSVQFSFIAVGQR